MIFFKRYQIKSLTKKLKTMRQIREHTEPSKEVREREIAYYLKLSRLYDALKRKKKYPFGALMSNEALRQASSLEHAPSQYELGRRILEEAKYRHRLEAEGVFRSIVNERQSKLLFEEAHALLESASRLGHILALRLLGLSYINGWGVTPAREKGFEMVVQSIEKEGSWAKVPQIFAEIGLNKPEFFSALAKRRAEHR